MLDRAFYRAPLFRQPPQLIPERLTSKPVGASRKGSLLLAFLSSKAPTPPPLTFPNASAIIHYRVAKPPRLISPPHLRHQIAL